MVLDVPLNTPKVSLTAGSRIVCLNPLNQCTLVFFLAKFRGEEEHDLVASAERSILRWRFGSADGQSSRSISVPISSEELWNSWSEEEADVFLRFTFLCASRVDRARGYPRAGKC